MKVSNMKKEAKLTSDWCIIGETGGRHPTIMVGDQVMIPLLYISPYLLPTIWDKTT